MENPHWLYLKPESRRIENAVGLASGAAFTLALTQIFNPVALGVAAAWGLGILGWGIRAMRRDLAATMVRDDYIAPIEDEFSDIRDLADSFARAAGTGPVRVYHPTVKLVQKSIPFFLRWRFRDPMRLISLAEGMVSALPRKNMIILSRTFINTNPKEVVRFALAHEIAHIKTDGRGLLTGHIGIFKKYTGYALLAGLGVTAIASLLGFAVPAITSLAVGTPLQNAALAGVLLMGVHRAAQLGLNYAQRIAERRADRNAVFLNGNADGAYAYLDRNDSGRKPFFETAPHPSCRPRIDNLRQAYRETLDYPPPPTAQRFSLRDPGLWPRP